MRQAADPITSVADIRPPQNAEEPILAPIIRGAVHEWLTEMRAWEELERLRVKPRMTALVEGPPGCGKTTLAHHIAARMGVPLVIVRADQLRSQYVGETGQKVAALFRSIAERHQESVMLIDEFDALASARAEERGGSDREHNAIVNSLLVRIENHRAPLFAATNRSDALDEAIWRRFGLRLQIPLPGTDERFAILKKYLAPWSMPDADIDRLTDATEGASPALLKDLAEGIKRDVALSPRLNRPADARSVLRRVIATARPHPHYDAPALWSGGGFVEQTAAELTWPPATGDAR